MWVKVNADILIVGEHVEAGSVVEVSKEVGDMLVLMGRAVAAEKPVKRVAAKGEEPVK